MSSAIKICRIPEAILYRPDLSLPEKVILGLAWSFEGGLSLSNSEIGRIVCLHSGSVSRILSKLESAGWIRTTGKKSRWRRIYFDTGAKVKDEYFNTGAKVEDEYFNTGAKVEFSTLTPALNYFNTGAKQNRKNKSIYTHQPSDSEPTRRKPSRVDSKDSYNPTLEETREYMYVLKDGGLWRLPEEKLSEYRRTFSGIDVASELRKAAQWLLDNPSRRKTAQGMPRFLSGWLGRVKPNTTSAAEGWELDWDALPSPDTDKVLAKAGFSQERIDEIKKEGYRLA